MSVYSDNFICHIIMQLNLCRTLSVRLEKNMEITAIFSIAATLHDSTFPESFKHKCFCYCIPQDTVDKLSLGTKIMD